MSKGFTLLELIIVIGILAILGAVSVLVLNPAQLFAQARDTSRISDLASLNSALGLYLSTATTPDLNGSYADSECASGVGGKYYAYATPTTNSFVGRTSATIVALRGVTGGAAGWLPVDFSSMTGGSPLSVLPVDPSNTGDYIYRYACDAASITYELDAKLESTKYSGNMSTDGGDNNNFYEVGNAPGLAL
ncbi:MAG: prepilin-type N-terminal cleavage/methylation domain-containing protein [Patescibacteria group bacterium]|nr:prepilin-type N-terminal cleavage/methylation domain-containing protein [Patescibacteria group bacterium]